MKKWAWLWIGVICAGWCQPTQAQTSSEPSAWKVEEKVDKLDGGKTIVLSVTSTDTLEFNGRKTAPGALIIRCTDHNTDIAINWPVYIVRPGNIVRPRWRTDDDGIVDDAWSTSRGVGNMLTHAQGAKYVKLFSGKKKLVFSVNITGDPQSLTFPIAGLDTTWPIAGALCKR